MRVSKVLSEARTALVAFMSGHREIIRERVYCMHCGQRYLGETHGQNKSDPPQHKVGCPVVRARKAIKSIDKELKFRAEKLRQALKEDA